MKPIKRLTAVLLSLLLILVPVSASAAQRTQFGMIDELEVSDNPGYIVTRQNALEKIYAGYFNHDETITLSEFNIPVSEVMPLFAASIGIYPEVFFVDRSISYSSNGTIITELSPRYLYTAAQVDTMLGEFYAKADEYLALIDEGMDDFTKALILHDQLAVNNAYSEWSEDGTVYSNNYTFMVEGWGRCENYAECYAYLLAQVGIKSEIINSGSMVHEWMKLRLDGSDYYYNVDLTFDDPLIDDADRPGKVDHAFFLLSDEAFRTVDSDAGRTEAHYDYGYINDSDTAFDSYNNLHTLENPLFYIGGELYTLRESGNKGYIATYDPADDSFDDKVEINERWRAGGTSYWLGNFSGIAEYDGLLYYNGENSVYVYDPESGQSEVYLDNVLSEGNSIYGLYQKDGRLYCLSAPDPNTSGTEVDLGELPKYYRVRFSPSAGSGEMQTIRTTEAQVELPDPSFTAPEGKTFAGWLDESGSLVGGTLTFTPGVYDYTLTANWLGEYGITVADSDYGTVSVSENTVLEGSNIEITALPDANCRLVSLTVTGENGATVTVNDNSFTMPDCDVIITAQFERISYAITTDGNASVYYNDEKISAAYPDTELSIELDDTAQPEEGSYFTGEYTLDGTGLGAAQGFTMPAHNVEIAAVQAQREELDIDFTKGDEVQIDTAAYEQLCRVFTTTYDASGDALVDLDDSGTADLRLTRADGEILANKLDTADKGGRLSYTFTGRTDKYGAVSVVIPILGDADLNGEINVNDATMLQKYLVGIYDDEISLSACDFNGDGKISIRDVTLIQMYVAGVI